MPIGNKELFKNTPIKLDSLAISDCNIYASLSLVFKVPY